MDEITILKSEVYDLLAQQQRINELLQEKNQKIIKLSQVQPKEQPKE